MPITLAKKKKTLWDHVNQHLHIIYNERQRGRDRDIHVKVPLTEVRLELTPSTFPESPNNHYSILLVDLC